MNNGSLCVHWLAVPSKQPKHVLERFPWPPHSPFFVYFNLEDEGLFSNHLQLRWWEVLCHATGMCNPSNPPTLLHPGSCKPLGIPSPQIKGGWVAFPLLSRFFTFHLRSQWHTSMWQQLISDLLPTNKPCTVLDWDILMRVHRQCPDIIIYVNIL